MSMHQSFTSPEALIKAAADRIEKLEAEVEQLKDLVSSGLILEFDDGSSISLDGIAGGGAPGGMFSYIRILHKDGKGGEQVWTYNRE